MAKKGENIYRRKDGRWEARYVKGFGPSGKAVYGSCYGRTYKEAKEKVAAVKNALAAREPPPPAGDSQSFVYFAKDWLLAEKGRVKESTYVKYSAILGQHILPRLGGRFPEALGTQAAEDFKQELLGEGLAPGTVKNILMVLRSVINYAEKRQPGAFPEADFAYPRESKREPRVLSVEEQLRLAEYLRQGMDPCRRGVLIALLTGLRIGELCALSWGSVRDGAIRVDRSMQRLKDTSPEGGGRTRVVIGPPKSDTSIRTIPLSDAAAKLCREMGPQDPESFVLTGTKRYMEPRTLQYRFKKYADDCGLEGVHFHTLRHTFATRCVEVGFELKSLSEILGHANTSITLDRYVHSSMDLKRENMNKLSVLGL